MTLAGTEAGASLDSATVNEPEGAALVNVTVPVDELPPVIVAGLTLTDESAAVLPPEAVTERITVRVTPPCDAEIADELLKLTALVETVKVALVAPAATVTAAGTVAVAVFELLSATEAPPAGAAADSVTVPVDGLPPATVVGLSVSVESVGPPGALTVSVADRVLPL